MAIKLTKGQKINLEKANGSALQNFCVGCNWGAIEKQKKFLGLFPRGKDVTDVDLDLSCIMVDGEGNICDYIYSPLYRKEFLDHYHLPQGKLYSFDHALRHSGDDQKGDEGGDDGLDNEIITVKLGEISPETNQIFFFLNNCGQEDFSQIPYASIRMYEGTPERVNEVFAQYDVAASAHYVGKTALIMGKLYKHNGVWKFAAIGDAYPDKNICITIIRILKDYARS